MSSRTRWSALLLIAAVVASACAAPPSDPEGTSRRVRGGTMRVGVTHHPPWVDLSRPDPSGVEAEIVERFASTLDASVEWFDGSEESLFAALEQGELDLVVGGLSATNPFMHQAAFTRPYLTTRVVIGVPSAEEVPEDVAGLPVAVEAGTEEAGLLRKTDARPVLVDDVMSATGARAVDDWLLDDLELTETGVTLSTTDHVMAVRLGENGWMVTLERFLMDHAAEIEDLLDAEGRP